MNLIINNRYDVQALVGSGGMGFVYTAFDRLTNQTVALKHLHTTIDLKSNQSRLALATEFRTLSSLRHPNIISVLNYGFDHDGVPYFTMELLHNADDLLTAALDRTYEERVGLCIQALQAMAYLHQRGVVHRDIKPKNILVTTQGVVRVLDFGLASDMLISASDGSNFRGTLAYAAPELINGDGYSPKVDLYSFGIVMYEVFAGRHPFDITSIRQLVIDIFDGIPDDSLIDAPPEIVAIIMRLMARDPAARYDTANEVIADLAAAIGQSQPIESNAIRESYLQAARFVGRNEEIKLLTASLQKLDDGIGSGWLIGGESGVGKSRLVEQIRTRALVQGVQVVQGQAVEEGGVAFQLWRDILPPLLLSTDVSDLEAGVLKRLVPHIALLIERPVEDAPTLNDSDDYQRLASTITAVIRRQTQPTLLILEDLQWAAESLLPLLQLESVLEGLPLFIVGTYRNDETPDLPAQIANLRVMQLGRLSETEIAELIANMVGEVDNVDDIAAFIANETEGNVFFIVETVRELAKSAGRLRDISTIELPTHVLSGGILNLVQRRLARMSDAERMALQLAAVAGREVDAKLFASILEDFKLDTDTFLTHAVNAAILDVYDNRWQFVHDKIRQAMLADISPNELPTIHRRVAEAIEAAYPNHDEYVGALADHWHNANDTDRELFYTLLAGHQRQGVSAYHEAITLYTRALDIMAKDDERLSDTLVRRGDTYLQLGHSDAAERDLKAGLDTATQVKDQFSRANAYYYLSQMAVLDGDFEKAETLLTQGFDTEIERNAPMLARLYYGLADVKWRQGDMDAAEQYCQLSLEMAETVNDLTYIMFAYNRLGSISFHQGNLDEAEHIHLLNSDLALQVGNRERAIASIGNLCTIAIKREDYVAARQYANDALAMAIEIGHANNQMLQESNLAALDLIDGDFESAHQRYYDVLSLAINKQLQTFILLAISGFADIRLVQNDATTAAQWLSVVRQHPAADVNVLIETGRKLEQARSVLGDSAFAAAVQDSATLSLEEIAHDILMG